GGAREREHAAHECPEHDPRRADLPQDRLLDARERRVHVQERNVRERRLDDPLRADAHGPDAEPDEQRADEERRRAERPPGRDPTRPDERLCTTADRVDRHYAPRAAKATARAKSTMRGPQREAMLSSIAITRW